MKERMNTQRYKEQRPGFFFLGGDKNLEGGGRDVKCYLDIGTNFAVRRCWLWYNQQ